MNDINLKGRSSLWPDKTLDWEKLFPFRRQLDANRQSTPDGASSDTIHYVEFKCENHCFLRRDLQRSQNEPAQFIGVYNMFLCLLFALFLFCMMRYVLEEKYTVISSQSFPFSTADHVPLFLLGFLHICYDGKVDGVERRRTPSET
jgi:hypothetical protein